MSANRYGRWVLALGTLAIGLVAGSLLGPRLLGEMGSQEALAAEGAHAPASLPTSEPTVQPVPPVDAPPPASVASPALPPGPAPAEASDVPPPAPPAASEVAPAGPSATPPPLPSLPEIQAPSDDRDERRWRERTVAVRDRLVAAYESCLAHAQTPYRYMFEEGRVVQIIDASAFAAAKAELLTARSALQFLQEDARRAGVPPGWVRVDWSGYPREPTPETGACERTLPEELQPR